MRRSASVFAAGSQRAERARPYGGDGYWRGAAGGRKGGTKRRAALRARGRAGNDNPEPERSAFSNLVNDERL